MRFGLVMCFALLSMQISAQNKIISGRIIDLKTKQGIPYVNVSLLQSAVGTSTDLSGRFTLGIQKADYNTKVHLSSIGYKDTTFLVKTMLKLHEFQLQPKEEQLDEVVLVSSKKQRFLEVNPINKKDIVGGFGSLNKQPYIFALYMPFDTTYASINSIEKVRVHLNKRYFFGSQKSIPSKFRFRLFSVSKDTLPNKDLVAKGFIVQAKKKERYVDINLSSYGIKFPKEGLYVAVEWLYIPFNAYEFTYTKGKVVKKKITETRYAPRLSWTKQKNKKAKLALCVNGKWLDKIFPAVADNEFIFPAISLTLSD